MLTELHIKDFAIIEQIDINFGAGLTIFTGETGAGKSIIIDAVETIIGGRAETTLVRTGSEHALVEGIFKIPDRTRDSIQTILEREQLFEGSDLISMAREVRVNGRNVARINGRSVNASLLKEIGEYLIDVHGQSEHLSLLRVSHHIELLDRFTLTDENFSVEEIRSAYQRTFHKLGHINEQLEELRQSEKDAARRAEMLDYQIKEIQAANLQLGEEENLLEERNRLANAETLAKYVQQSLVALDEGTPDSPAAIELLGHLVTALDNLVRLDRTQESLLEMAQSSFENLNEITIDLRNYLETVEYNPNRLNSLEERLELIQTLKRKYGETIPEILAYLDRAAAEFQDIERADEKILELETERSQLLVMIAEQGKILSQKRRSAAELLEKSIESELSDLNMSQARFKVDFQIKEDQHGVPYDSERRVAYGPTGLEQVEFLIAPNPGEGFKPLVRIASGGETSRLMLAMKNVLARADQIQSLIFDEIDQGIGGRIGAVVGEKLWTLARQHQVFCITHLPQLAAFGDHHFHVQKHIDSGRTTTQVQSLKGEQRLIELAQMLGEVSEGTMHSAHELSDLVYKRTKGLS
jgi:DNA repair protein RecN (Recombination protein N)